MAMKCGAKWRCACPEIIATDAVYRILLWAAKNVRLLKMLSRLNRSLLLIALLAAGAVAVAHRPVLAAEAHAATIPAASKAKPKPATASVPKPVPKPATAKPAAPGKKAAAKAPAKKPAGETAKKAATAVAPALALAPAILLSQNDQALGREAMREAAAGRFYKAR